MNKFYVIIFIIILINAIIYLIKNSKNPNKNNVVIKKYNFSQEVENIENVNRNNERVSIIGNEIFINNNSLRNTDIEVQPIFKLEKDIPEIKVFEDGSLIRTFIIEPRSSNPNLKGQYFYSSIRVNSNSSIQIDGYVSKNPTNFEENDEGIRFQPFYLSDKQEINDMLKGKGMFQRGLHYNGIISSGNIRLICICDECKKSFSVEFYHAGFSEVQYFYSSNSKETLLVSYYNETLKVPYQLQNEINIEELTEMESNLPKSNDGKFEYYNSFKCPHCNFDFINFRENKDLRPNEYYVNYHINQKPLNI